MYIKCMYMYNVLCLINLCIYIVDFLHEVSNDGARAQFESYLKFLIPTLVQCAKVR